VTADSEDSLQRDGWSGIVRQIRARTPARLLAGRVGAAYRTNTQIELREAHAAARDAVRAELGLERLGSDFIQRYGLFEVWTQANSKDEYLLQPNLGRTFSTEARSQLLKRCTQRNDLQIVIGDGLSVTAVYTQVPELLPTLCEGAKACGWSLGQPFVIRHCRVGILNEIGELLKPAVAILLIGERPGLATAESLSAYMAYHPQRGQTDADRNLISNIHVRGVEPKEAVARILDLAMQMIKTKCSGTQLRAETPALGT